jgi:hypothetical protein
MTPYKSLFKETSNSVDFYESDIKTTIMAPVGTVFIKVNSHRARDYMKRYKVPYITFYNMYIDSNLALIYEKDLDKLGKVKGISKPFTKITSKGTYGVRGSFSTEYTLEEQELIDLFYKINNRYN